MNHSKTVAKNSIWLIIQPLILNILSLFVIGYIARTLGNSDYGKFTFAFAFITMFMPITNLGLSSITTREIAENRSNASQFLGKMIPMRLFLSFLALALIIIIVNIMKYPSDTKTVVYLAGITLIFYSITITFNSLFQGFEKMQYMFYYQFISGLILTIFSVLILFFGCRLLGLTLVYYFGSFLGLIISIYFVTKIIPSMAIKIDTIFWKESFLKGMPFFIPALLAMVGSKFGVILLSKLAGDASVGVYGAALVIVDRLTVIPDGICTALFPTIASVYQRSKEDAISLFQKVFLYLVLLGLPMAVGTTLLASPIIKLIYGSKYQDSSLVLQILIWWLFMVFVNAIQSSTLSAIHREKKVAILPFISMPIYIFMNFLLIPKYGANGTAVSSIIASLVSSVVVYKITKKYFTSKLIEFKILLKILLANLIMAVTIMFLASLNLFFTITAGVLSYAIAVFMLKVIDWADVKKMTNLVTKKQIILDNNPE